MEPLKVILYSLAILTSFACAAFLYAGYRRRRVRLLLWSALCFAFLTASNVILFVDLLILPHIDLRPARLLAALIGMAFLLYAFIWESE